MGILGTVDGTRKSARGKKPAAGGGRKQEWARVRASLEALVGRRGQARVARHERAPARLRPGVAVCLSAGAVAVRGHGR